MEDKRKGLLGGLFGRKDKEEPKKPEAKKDQIAEKKQRAEQMEREAAQKAKAEKMKQEAAVKKHVVVSGDTLSGIAKQYYDDAGKYMKIYEANKDVIGDNPDLIKPGQELVIPKL
jgi:nucleoid-associated protein YgaU